jgi:hypothetical protein
MNIKLTDMQISEIIHTYEEHKAATAMGTPNYEQKYKDSTESSYMNMFDFGMLKLGNLAKQKKRGLITYAEYTLHRDAIEAQLLLL